MAIIFLTSFIIFLFILYILCREDVVLIRKDIKMDKVFDMAFLGVIAVLFFSRLLYVLFNFKMDYLNPLTFLLFTHFPGLSLHGGIIGAVLFVIWYSFRNKFPVGRMIDFSLYSLFAGMVSGLILNTILSYVVFSHRVDLSIVITVLYSIVFIFFTSYLLTQHRRGQLKDGTIGLLFLITYSIFSFLSHVVDSNAHVLFQKEDIVLLFIASVSLYFLLKQSILKLRKVN